jgi:hypothetical protein
MDQSISINALAQDMPAVFCGESGGRYLNKPARPARSLQSAQGNCNSHQCQPASSASIDNHAAQTLRLLIYPSRQLQGTYQSSERTDKQDANNGDTLTNKHRIYNQPVVRLFVPYRFIDPSGNDIVQPVVGDSSAAFDDHVHSYTNGLHASSGWRE